MRDISTKVPAQLGHRGRDQPLLQVRRSLATTTHSRAHADHIGRNTTQLT
jgi:hypothetical protein